MPRNVRSARGDIVNFDEILIKQQLADASQRVIVDVENQRRMADVVIEQQQQSQYVADNYEIPPKTTTTVNNRRRKGG